MKSVNCVASVKKPVICGAFNKHSSIASKLHQIKFFRLILFDLNSWPAETAYLHRTFDQSHSILQITENQFEDMLMSSQT